MAEEKEYELKVIDNPEWLKVDVDAKQHILHGIKHNGVVDYSTGELKPEEIEQLKKKFPSI